MPSQSLERWRNDRMPRLQEVENQCASTSVLIPPNAYLADENLRGYTVLLSAHFQGFCRDLYSECTQIILIEVQPIFQVLIQTQFTTGLVLDHGNPTLDNLKKDFKRFDLTLDLSSNPANQLLIQDLAALNKWRNIVAHQGEVPPSGFPALPTLQSWRNSCNDLGTLLDNLLYNRLLNLLNRQPWTP